MGKRTFPLAVVILLLALSFPARAQQPNKVPRIGFVTGSGDPTKPGALVEAFQ